ncbi:hypothetical protein PV797_03370 [Clostridiaceae bacterium M8S5]|nr:hypothetical protein PV797_03370 [Clostridiaceae bacterium M8S5]
MTYKSKTNWNRNDIVSETDLNRIETGLEDAHEKLINTVTSVNSKIGDIVLSAEDVGAETSVKVQEKVDTAERKAKSYTDEIAKNKVSKNGNSLTGLLKAQSNTSYTVRQIRNIILSEADADVNAMQNGDIWIKYE